MQRQLAIKNAVASGIAALSASELPAAMKPNRIFVASASLDVLTVDQQGCSVSAGDVLMLENPPTEDSPLAALRVQASRQSDCPVGELVSADVQDPQEWQNEMRAQIDAGMAEMRSGQDQGLTGRPVRCRRASAKALNGRSSKSRTGQKCRRVTSFAKASACKTFHHRPNQKRTARAWRQP